MPERVACNLCGADDPRTLYALKDYRYFVDDVEWSVVRCRRCGLGYLNPRPTRDEIARYYPAPYYSQRDSLGTRYRLQAQYVNGTPGRLLDIGAARGDFLAVMHEKGWEVQGIEPSVEAENPYGVPIQRAAFPEESDFPSAHFDAITAWAVFEHLHDPRSAFVECARLLRPGGVLVIQVPNLRSVHGRLSRMEDVPRHLYFFTPRALHGYADRAGLAVERIEHVTHLVSGASGREAIRFAAIRAIGGSQDEFFRIYRTPRSERLRRWPLLLPIWLGSGVLGRILFPDWLVRIARISGQIVVVFRKQADVVRSVV